MEIFFEITTSKFQSLKLYTFIFKITLKCITRRC
nr:MAG TPA: hypothetical protein [Caudoviricetes sp.]